MARVSTVKAELEYEEMTDFCENWISGKSTFKGSELTDEVMNKFNKAKFTAYNFVRTMILTPMISQGKIRKIKSNHFLNLKN